MTRIEAKVDRLDQRLDEMLTRTAHHGAAVTWLKWAVGGAWVALGVLFGLDRHQGG